VNSVSHAAAFARKPSQKNIRAHAFLDVIDGVAYDSAMPTHFTARKGETR
jgi:hypothetical protein